MFIIIIIIIIIINNNIKSSFIFSIIWTSLSTVICHFSQKVCIYQYYCLHMLIYNHYIYFFHWLLSHISIVETMILRCHQHHHHHLHRIFLYIFYYFKYRCLLFTYFFLPLFTISPGKCAVIYTTFRICVYITIIFTFFLIVYFPT